MRKLLRKWRVWIKPSIVFMLIGIFIGNFPQWYPLLKEFRQSNYKGSVILAIPLYDWEKRAGIKYRVVKCNDNKLIDRDYLINRYFYLIQESPDIDLQLLINLTNDSAKPTQIQYYSLDVKTSKLGWIHLKRIELKEPYIMYAESADYSKANPNRYHVTYFSDNYFDFIASSTILEPGHSFKGWSLFQIDNDNLDTIGKILEFRMKILDNRNNLEDITLPYNPDMLSFEKINVTSCSDEKPVCSNN